MMLRGLYGMNMGLMSVYAVTDSYSLYDIDLFNFCLQLPLKLRVEHKLYTHWITHIIQMQPTIFGSEPGQK